MNREDGRFEACEEALRQAFDRLCGETDPEHITVAQVSKAAGVARSTFYRHYEGMSAMLEAMENSRVEKIAAIMYSGQSGLDEKTVRSFFAGICGYVLKDNYLRSILASMNTNSLTGKLLKVIRRYAGSALSDTFACSAEEGVYALTYSLGGITGILHRWCAEGCTEDPAEAAGMLSLIYLNGMRGYLRGSQRRTDCIAGPASGQNRPQCRTDLTLNRIPV